MIRHDESVFVAPGQLDTLARLKALMSEWAAWMARGGYSAGYPSRACGLFGEARCRDSQELCDSSDAAKYLAISAALDDIGRSSPARRCALERCYGVCVVYRFIRQSYPYERALADAHEDLLRLLPRRAVFI